MKKVICPVCHEELVLTENQKSVTCSNDHLFDLAKQGYLNLLLAQHKKSKNPGDTADMVNARTRFLNQGYYQEISDTLCQIINALLSTTKITAVNYCDIACGEGYYTKRANDALQSTLSEVNTTGLDISLPAIKAACKRDKSITWLIASLAQMPLSPMSQNLATVLFCRADPESLSNILQNEGYLIIAETGPAHLQELRKLLYKELKDETVKDYQDTDSMRLVDSQTLTTSIPVKDSENIIDLLSMTPHYWKTSRDKKEELNSVKELDLTIDVRFLIYQKIIA